MYMARMKKALFIFFILAALASPAHAFDHSIAAEIANRSNELLKAGRHHEAYKNSLPLALAGSVGAQEMIGDLYAAGRGVPQDFPRAYMWLNLAASSSGVDRIIKKRNALIQKMTPQQIARGQDLTSRYMSGDPGAAY